MALGMSPKTHRAEVAPHYRGESEKAAANAAGNKIGSLLFRRWGWPAESEEGDGDAENTRTRRPP